MYTKDTLVSVIIVGENNGDDELLNVYKNVLEGTHKNLDVIVSTFRNADETKDVLSNDNNRDKCVLSVHK